MTAEQVSALIPGDKLWINLKDGTKPCTFVKVDPEGYIIIMFNWKKGTSIMELKLPVNRKHLFHDKAVASGWKYATHSIN